MDKTEDRIQRDIRHIVEMISGDIKNHLRCDLESKEKRIIRDTTEFLKKQFTEYFTVQCGKGEDNAKLKVLNNHILSRSYEV